MHKGTTSPYFLAGFSGWILATHCQLAPHQRNTTTVRCLALATAWTVRLQTQREGRVATACIHISGLVGTTPASVLCGLLINKGPVHSPHVLPLEVFSSLDAE